MHFGILNKREDFSIQPIRNRLNWVPAYMHACIHRQWINESTDWMNERTNEWVNGQYTHSSILLSRFRRHVDSKHLFNDFNRVKRRDFDDLNGSIYSIYLVIPIIFASIQRVIISICAVHLRWACLSFIVFIAIPSAVVLNTCLLVLTPFHFLVPSSIFRWQRALLCEQLE